MQANLVTTLAHQQPSTAVGAFTCYEFTVAAAAVRAAETAGTAVILLVPPGAAGGSDGRRLITMLRALADRADVPVCLELDHAARLDVMRSALEYGVDAVMADGSRLEYSRNVELVASAVEMAQGFGASVESELGILSGNEDRATGVVPAGQMTDPLAVADFVRDTRTDLLAVSIGNRHGGRPSDALDWDRLDAIASNCTVPLALHGASGLSTRDLLRALAGGVAKVNVNTEVRRSMFTVLAESLPELEVPADMHTLVSRLINTNTEVVAAFIETFAGRDTVISA